MVGMVSCHNDDDTISMVEVEFHNASTYHSFSVPNNIGWTMASLSEQALLLAVEKIESESRYIYTCRCIIHTDIHVCTCTCLIYTDIHVHVHVLYTNISTCTCNIHTDMYTCTYIIHTDISTYMYIA